MPMQCFMYLESRFWEQNRVLPIQKFLFLVLSNLSSTIFQVAAHMKLKTQENFKILVQKVVAVAYEML